MVAASPVIQLGLLHMRPIQFWLKQRVPSAAWRHGHRVTVTRGCVSKRDPRHGAQKEGYHDRARANRPSVFSPKRGRAYTSTA